MTLDQLRPIADRLLTPFVAGADRVGLTPNSVSVISLAVAAAAAAPVALAGATAFAIKAGISRLAEASPALRAQASILGEAMDLFFRPVGDAVADTIAPVDVWETYLDTLGAVVDEARIHFNDEGVSSTVVDPANVAVVGLRSLDDDERRDPSIHRLGVRRRRINTITLVAPN